MFLCRLFEKRGSQFGHMSTSKRDLGFMFVVSTRIRYVIVNRGRMQITEQPV